jgi:hypothetical protein
MAELNEDEHASAVIVRERKGSSCCPPAAQTTCCEPSAKAECCDSDRHAAGECDCRPNESG